MTWSCVFLSLCVSTNIYIHVSQSTYTGVRSKQEPCIACDKSGNYRGIALVDNVSYGLCKYNVRAYNTACIVGFFTDHPLFHM